MKQVMGAVVAGFVILVCCTVGAADKAGDAGAPRSPAAVAAMKKHDRAVARAREAYQAALAAAGRDLKGEMDVALKGAMRAQDLEEAKRIEAAVQRAEASDGAAGSETFVVKTVLLGLPDNWMDLTDDVKRAGWVREGNVDLPTDIASKLRKDPAPGRVKQLQMLLSVNGQDVRIWSNDITGMRIQAGAGR